METELQNLDVVDMLGKYLFTLDGISYNIDHLDISQFTQIYLVNAAPPR